MEDKWILWVLQLPHRVWVLLLATIVVLVIGQALLSGDQLISHPSTDIANHFLFSRAFGFGEIARGDFPLWNPFTYGGAPYLGQFQSALLYPPNLLFLTLPIGQALNWSIALHVFLLGLGVYAWLIGKRISRPASFLAAVAMMCGGPFFLHIYAGHLSNLCTMAWVPFLFLCIDSWLEKRHSKWILLASLIVALQITAGHPQYVYYTAILAVPYAFVQGVGLPRPLVAAGGFLCIYFLAALLSAAQLWPDIRAAAETSRTSGTDYAFASTFSFPPENLLTLISPWFFGDIRSQSYWGRCYLWEIEAYMGVGILLLAIFGATKLRRTWRPLILLGLALLLALGRHTPLYDVMFHIMPLYNSFRGTSKFLFFAALFVALLAAQGFDRLLQGEKPRLSWGIASLVLGACFIIAGLVLASGGPPSDSWWQWGWNQIFLSGESYLPKSIFASVDSMAMAKQGTAHTLVIGGGILALFGVAMGAIRRWPEVLWLIGIGAIVEIAIFAHNSVETFPLRNLLYPGVAEATAQLPADSRVLNLLNPDSSLLLQNEGIWGYDPSVLKRYAQLLAHSQGMDPDRVTQYIAFNRPSKILELLRCKKVFFLSEKGVEQSDLKSDFPRFFLSGSAIVIPKTKKSREWPSKIEWAKEMLSLRKPGSLATSDRTAIFAAMDIADLRNQVVLEESPHPPPSGSPPQGTVTVLKQSNHCWQLQVDTDRPTLLVNTDAWSADWQARALPGSVQQKYQVLPADYALRAIPLSAGRHLLELSYWPRGWGIAIAISVLTLFALIVRGSWFVVRRHELI